MKILVTGGAGFIGSSIVNRLLIMNHEVIAVDNFSQYYSNDLKRSRIKLNEKYSNFRLFEYDINDPQLYVLLDKYNIETVIHLAAQPGVRVQYPESLKYLDDNLSGFSKIFSWALKNEIKSFIYTSSSSVYQKDTTGTFSESSVLDVPTNFYAKTKWINEQIATEFIGKSSTRILGLRLFSVYGPWGRPDMAPLRIIASCLTDYRFLLNSDGNTRRDFTFISDVTNLIYELISLDELPEGVLNIGAGNDHSINEMIDIIRKISGLDPKIDHNSEDLKEIIRTKSDGNKLKKILGDFSYTPLEIGMSKTFEWAKSPEIKSNLEKWVASV
jgi:UDP-glucuronate 4-epimerase